ncbi:hypothetical protein C8Q73DRAFT_215959 [Cubamyces lactineus]|nr:hypothetical protein C8Q73DRAFT_215959 [Cubamyces lactineus]
MPHVGVQTTVQLPLDIWRHVIEILPRADQRSCLFVSRDLHQIAFSQVFSRVTICFGLYQARWLTDDENDKWDEFDYEEWERQNDASYESLRQIMQDPAFALTIRELSVRAYASTDRLFELRLLRDALKCLPNLRSFRWSGAEPQLPIEVVKALSASCGANLRQLNIPVVTGLFELISEMSSLRMLCLNGDPTHVVNLARLDEDLEDEVVYCLEETPPTLRQLWVYDDLFLQAPVHRFYALQELFMMWPNSLEGVEQVFHHCTDLRSLGILASHRSSCAMELRNAMAVFPTALPRLHSLKLALNAYTHPRRIVDTLASFVRDRRGLRRLDVSFNSLAKADTFAWPFYETFRTLLDLEVLGLEMQGSRFTEDHVKRLDIILPLGLKAMLLDHYYSVTKDETVKILLHLFSKRTKLRYLHCIDQMYNHSFKEHLAEDYWHPPSLELVGYGPQLYPIRRDPVSGTRFTLPFWDYTKVQFRTVHEFDGCEDSEWLLRGHGWAGPDALSPGLYTD